MFLSKISTGYGGPLDGEPADTGENGCGIFLLGLLKKKKRLGDTSKLYRERVT